MYGNSDTRFSTIRGIFPALWQLEISIRISRTFWNIGLKKISAFFDIWYIAIWISRFFSFGEVCKYKKCGKFKLKFPNVKKCGKIQITRTLKQVSHFLHFLYFSTFYYFCNVFPRNTLKKNGGKNKIQTEYMHIMMYF